MSKTWVTSVVARNIAWQNSGVQIGPGQRAVLTAKGTWGVIDPAHRPWCDASGNGVMGTGDIRARAMEGALLCMTADGNIYAFPAGCVMTLPSIPGPLKFVANDYTQTGAGYTDNQGALIVEIQILNDIQPLTETSPIHDVADVITEAISTEFRATSGPSS